MLSTIANIFNGDSINEQEKAQKYYGQAIGYNYIGTKDVNFNHTINYNNGVKIPYDTSFKIAHKNTPLLCIEGGSAGRKIGILEEDVCFGNKLCAFETYSINSVYLFYFLQCSEFVQIFKHNTQGIIGGVSINTIKKLPFLLPPLEEQARIVKRIEELFVQIDIIDQNQADIDTLYEEFRKRTLTLAIQGKLVPQDPNDEPASVLLERIRAEKKVKLDKKYVDSYIYKGDDNCYYEKVKNSVKEISEEIPFEIPESWRWIRIDSLFQHNTGKALNSSNSQGVLHPYITTSNVYWGHFSLDRVKEMPFTKDEFAKCSIVPGDLLVCEGGDVGRAAIWDKDIPMCIQNHIHRLRTYYPVCTAFYYFAFFVYKSIGLIGGKGIGIQGLSSGALGKLIFPLPPLTEQERIVKQVEIILEKLKDED